MIVLVWLHTFSKYQKHTGDILPEKRGKLMSRDTINKERSFTTQHTWRHGTTNVVICDVTCREASLKICQIWQRRISPPAAIGVAAAISTDRIGGANRGGTDSSLDTLNVSQWYFQKGKWRVLLQKVIKFAAGVLSYTVRRWPSRRRRVIRGLEL